jgi:hypothetical protein
MKISEIQTEEDAVMVAKELLSKNGRKVDLEVLYAQKVGKKCLSLRKEGWLVSFKLDVPEGFEPNMFDVELYPSLEKFVIPPIL